MVTRYLCEGCGKPRERADTRWCEACVRKLHAVICKQPWGHRADCDPPPRLNLPPGLGRRARITSCRSRSWPGPAA